MQLSLSFRHSTTTQRQNQKTRTTKPSAVECIREKINVTKNSNEDDQILLYIHHKIIKSIKNFFFLLIKKCI